MADITERERDVLVQCLTGGSGEVYRNYYCADPAHHSWPEIVRLMERDFLRMGAQVTGQRYRYFHCTPAGARAVGLHAPHDRSMSGGAA